MKGDCPNAEIRDLLPDLLHDRLDANVRARVAAHLEACTDCEAELQLLRDVQAVVVERTPRVDLAACAGRLGSYRRSRRSAWGNWRIAAAILVLAGGGSTLAVLEHDRGLNVSDTLAVGNAPAGGARSELTVTGRLDELDDAQLQSLLKDIEHLDAVPITEPEPVALPVGVSGSSADDEGEAQ